MAQISIPLSYSKIVGDDLLRVLSDFEGKSHEELITAFENKVAEITTSPFVVALNSGTAAIHLALKLLGVSKDDIVPVSTFTYVGSVNPIFYVGARPAFIDSEAETWNMDPELLETCLRELSSKNKLPKAFIVVHAYGMPAKMEDLVSIAKAYTIPIIEDAAEALGAKYKGQPAGSIGEIGILSFNNNKSITTFGGGVLLTKSREVYEKVKFLATQAREVRPFYEHKEVGFNYRMSPLNAAYGLAQLGNMRKIIEERRATFEQYRKDLKSPEIAFLDEPEHFFSSRWLSTVLLGPKRNPLSIQSKLSDAGIESRPLWNPMHCQPAFMNEIAYKNGMAEQLFRSGLCLPSGENLSKEVQEKVIDELRRNLGYK